MFGKGNTLILFCVFSLLINSVFGHPVEHHSVAKRSPTVRYFITNTY